jgi:hypothetical protein
MTERDGHAGAASWPFAADEWALLAEAPLMAAMMVLAAGRRGNVRGTLAVAREYAAARERGSSPLLAKLLSGPAPDVRARTRDREALAGKAPPAIRAALALLAREASEDDRNAYARFLLGVAAAAAGTGGRGREAALRKITEIVEETHSG